MPHIICFQKCPLELNQFLGKVEDTYRQGGEEPLSWLEGLRKQKSVV